MEGIAGVDPLQLNIWHLANALAFPPATTIPGAQDHALGDAIMFNRPDRPGDILGNGRDRDQ